MDSEEKQEVAMRVVIIGGTGHVGTYLVPRLVEAGHEVVTVSRGQRKPYQTHAAWRAVQQVTMDRLQKEQEGSFAQEILDLKPDVVIDMICFKPESARHLVEALRGKIQHFLLTGTTWVHGYNVQVPCTEDESRNPFGEYGIQKAAIEAYLLDQARRCGFPATILHPGHVVGVGWAPINPAGNLNLEVWECLAKGEELALPNLGLGRLHHVHADDVAQLYMRALQSWSAAAGESFHAVSPAALTLRGYAEAVASWFGQTARLRFLPWEEWARTVSERDARLTADHIRHSPSYSIAKAQRLLGYQPRYTSLEAIYESVAWLIEKALIDAPSLR